MSVCVAVCANACACVCTVKSTLGAEGSSLQFRHIVSYLLWFIGRHPCEELLHEVIICVGYFTVLNADNQVCSMPTFVLSMYGVPSFVNGVPSFVNGVPSFVNGVPSFVNGMLSFVNGVPSFVNGVPSFVNGVPSFVVLMSVNLSNGTVADTLARLCFGDTFLVFFLFYANLYFFFGVSLAEFVFQLYRVHVLYIPLLCK